jgi:hypothetical protein
MFLVYQLISFLNCSLTKLWSSSSTVCEYFFWQLIMFKFTTFFISRDVVKPTVTSTSIMFNSAMQAQYPSYCLDVLDCKKTFREHVVSKFLDNQKFVLTVPFVDGRSLTFEASLNGFTTNYGKYEYTSSTSSRKKIKTKQIRYVQTLEKLIIKIFLDY